MLDSQPSNGLSVPALSQQADLRPAARTKGDSLCPLCGGVDSRASWLGSTFFAESEYEYVECLGCRSLYCQPMPEPAALRQMYDGSYEHSFDGAGDVPDPKQPGEVIAVLLRQRAGIFLDFGCGGGQLLTHASKIGWDVLGVEMSPDVARSLSARLGLKVVPHSELSKAPLADVLHMGDVIEHLVDPFGTLTNLITRLKPGGLLVAQGPLEANANLFTLALKLSRYLRPGRHATMPPYHVMLATATGQRLLFERVGLQESSFLLSEVAWPAPGRLSASSRPRDVALFLLRGLSRLFSACFPTRLGNRYFYVGRWSPRSS